MGLAADASAMASSTDCGRVKGLGSAAVLSGPDGFSRLSEKLMTIGTVERALQLAPECRTMEEVRAKLVREGHSNIDAHLQGSLRRDLRKLLKSGT